ncbi:MAG: hypothetical protein RL074_1597 [Bacteroidota bacterium]
MNCNLTGCINSIWLLFIVYKFYLAFIHSELDYFKFYKTIPTQEAYATLQEQIPGISDESTLRAIKGQAQENHKNVVLITLESYSADFI